MMHVEIIGSTDGKHIGSIVAIEEGEVIDISSLGLSGLRRRNLWPGVWRYANSNYVIEVKEIA